jgi:phage recombination protein Bet
MRKSQLPDETGGQPVPLAEQKIQKETVIEYLKAFNYAHSLSESEKNQFIQTAIACNLDPFKREIYITCYGEGEYRKVSILTGYQAYLKRAERTGKLDGWNVSIIGEKEAMKAVVEIFRKDWSHSFTHEVFWTEAAQKKKDGGLTSFWLKQPRFQLKKVAIAQGFRLAFPDELGGLPFDSAEVPNAENTDTETPSPRIPENNAGKPVKASNRRGAINTLAREALQDDPPITEATTSAQSESAAPVTMNAPETTTTSSDALLVARSPEQLRQNVIDLLNYHRSAFTEKHRLWILEKTNKAAGKSEIIKMLNYASKVIQKANSEQEESALSGKER